MVIRSRFLAAAAFIAVSAGGMAGYAHWASAKLPDTFSSLAGRWAGQGIVRPASGPAENFRCVVTYIPQGSSARMQQNLRCQSTNYRLDAATQLELRGERVVGRWQENSFAGLTGTVHGVAKDGGFDVVLNGQFFQARMVIATASKCEQSVRVVPARADYIREMSASLKKC